jgi:hypothetical protein
VYNEYIGQVLFKFGYNISYKIIDRGIFEIFGPLGLSTAISKKAFIVTKLQSSFIYHYTLLILIGSTFLLGIRQFWIIFGETFDYRLFVIFFILLFFTLKNNKINVYIYIW